MSSASPILGWYVEPETPLETEGGCPAGVDGGAPDDGADTRFWAPSFTCVEPSGNKPRRVEDEGRLTTDVNQRRSERSESSGRGQDHAEDIHG